MSTPPEVDSYSIDRSSCQVETFYFDLLGQGRVFTSHWYDREGRVADFVMVQQVSLMGSSSAEEAWGEVVRVDCCHEEVHAHHFNPDGDEIDRQVLKAVRTRADLAIGLDLAETLVYERWEDNLRRWERGC